MEVIFIYVAIAVALFVASYIHKRRFGLLGLALAAGSILSNIWGREAEMIVAIFGVRSSPVTSAIVLSAIILLPAVILLFHGYTYNNLIGRVLGASLFTLLAQAFLIEPLGHMLMPQGVGSVAYNYLIANKSVIIGGGLSPAIVDLFLTKPASLSDKRHKH